MAQEDMRELELPDGADMEDVHDEDFRIVWQKPFQISDVGDTVRAGVAKAEYAMKNAKAYTALKWDIMDLQTQCRRKLLLVGKLVYATYSGNPTSFDVLEEALAQADALTRELREKEAELALICGVRLCPGCGAAESTGHVFCSRCGRRLLEEEE